MKCIFACLLIIFYFNCFSQKIQISNLVTANLESSYNAKFFAQHQFSRNSVSDPVVNNCYDSSFTKPFSFTNQAVSVSNTLHTSDDGILVCGYMNDTTKYLPYTHDNGFILKMDSKGKILWVKQIENGNHQDTSFIGIGALKELANHDIIASGFIDTAIDNIYAAIILRLDKDGNLIWYKSLQTSLFPSAANYSLGFGNITEASNGDLILCGSSSGYNINGSYETVVRMNEQGDIIWSDDFGNNKTDSTGYIEGIAAFTVNGNILECGLSFGDADNNYINMIHFLTLNYANGNLVNKKFFAPDYSNVIKSINKGLGQIGAVKCKLLNNGHFIVYGVINQQILIGIDSSDYFGVAEFDASFNLVNSYSISSPTETDINAEDIEVTDNGKVYYTLGSFTETKSDLFVVSDNGNQSSKSRKYYESDASPLILFNDDGYGFIQHNIIDNSLQFTKMHDVDTTSDCFGTDSLLTIHAPYNLKQVPNFKYLDNNIPNKVYSASYNLSVSDFTAYTSEDECVQQNNCDSIHIHGKANICGVDDVVYFTATRNKNCGAFAQWAMDTSVFNSLKQVNDTTVAIRFKSINWNGKLYAHLATASCNINAPYDSIELHVKSMPVAKLNLGADTIFCANPSPLLLHAGTNFKTYTWQNGSSDSTFAVTTTGKYFVTVLDQCNNLESDTIQATTAMDAFRINNDTAKCNNDSVYLKAPAGFTNYTWQPNYNLKAVTNNVVQVYPSTDTTYIASADLASCAVQSKTHIQVFHSPAINLGNDTSVCSGTKLLLNAGNGFDHYTWNNGAQSKIIYVDNVGVYSVKAIANNNCASYDTINIVSLKPLPFVDVGNDTILCSDEKFTLTPVIKNADKYYWQDGSTLPALLIKAQGEYSLIAVNSCGVYKDSIKVTQSECKLVLPSAFTPNNDGLNDVFKVKYPFPVKSYKMIIYNRWGQQVFVSEDMAKGWGGSFHGLPVSTSTFIWVVTITDLKNVETALHGTVTVIR